MAKSVITVPVRGTVEFDRFAPIVIPDPPTLQNVVAGDQQNALAWTSSNGAVGYRVYFSTSPGVTTGSTSIDVGLVTNFAHTGLVNGTTYYYRVQALGSGGGESALSNELSGTPFDSAFTNTASLELDGISQYGVIARAAAGPISFARNNPRTYNMWVRPGDISANMVLFSDKQGTSLTTGHGTVIYINSTGQIVCHIGANGGSGLTTSTIQTVNSGTYYMVTVRYDGSSSNTGLEIFLNGVLQAVSQSGTISSSTSISDNVFIGATGTTSATGDYYDGLIDEMSIFDDDLTLAEVAELYNSGAPGDLASHSANADLVAWYRMGDSPDGPLTVFDRVGTASITLINDPEYSNILPSTLFTNNFSVSFDDSAEYVTIGTPADLNFSNTDPFSISMWVLRPVIAGNQTLVAKAIGTNNQGWLLYLDTNAANRLLIHLNNSGANQIRKRYTLGAGLTGNWFHLVVTYDGSSDESGVNCYVNGSLAGGETVLENGLTLTMENNAPVNIGMLSNNVTNPWGGNLDEIAFFDKELSGAEVTELFNSNQVLDLSQASFIGDTIHWYRMGDGDTYPIIKDQIQNFDGIMINMDSSNFDTAVP